MGELMSRDESTKEANRTSVATLGGGCFWCTEAVFSQVAGVLQVEPGYAGGAVANPTYEQVSTGRTGHAEAVQISFDPEIISFKELLELFFATHDPTTRNRQGADVGSQYRSVIFYHSQKQKAVAEQTIQQLEDAGIFDAPIVTEVEPFSAFYRAESYHRDFFKLHPEHAYCQVVISPKVAKLREHHRDKLKKDA
jgi:peptide-methionine (S)-S-oxide reductase